MARAGRSRGRVNRRGRQRLPRIDPAHFNMRRAMHVHAELHRSRIRQIDQAALVKWTAIIDPHDHAAAVLQIRDTRITRQRERAMRRAELIHIVGLEARGRTAIELGAVPRGHAALEIAARARQHGVGLAKHHVGRAVAVVRQRLGVRDRFGKIGDIRRDLRRAIGHPRRVQAARRVRTERLPRLAGRTRRCGRSGWMRRRSRGRALLLLFRARSEQQRDRQHERMAQQRCGCAARRHGVVVGSFGVASFAAIASASWNTAISSIGELMVLCPVPCARSPQRAGRPPSRTSASGCNG